nr:restriction endonuclease subunit S [Haemophilus parainfluenzae]
MEQIAQALFKSWFVDFDPVRAKVQALSDGLSLEQAELAAMQAISRKTPEELTALSQTQPDRYAELAETAKAFPCEMVEVDGVEVPKGWRIGTFTDITESRREKVKNDKAMVLSAVSSGELVKSEEYFTKQVFSKSIDKYLKVYKWDFAYNPARINIGSIGLHEADYLGAVSPVYEVFSVSDKYHWFLKRILNLETTKIKIQSLCTGSVRQTLKLKDFQSIDCVIPDEKTLSIFNKKWEEYRTLILENNKNTQTLSEIRDLLLPRLLSGKIEND